MGGKKSRTKESSHQEMCLPQITRNENPTDFIRFDPKLMMHEVVDVYYEQCRLINPTREKCILPSIKEELMTNCGFDAYLEDEESLETHERLKSLTIGRLDLDQYNFYKGFVKYELGDN